MRLFWLAVLLAELSLASAAMEKESWLPVTQQEWAIKDVPGYRGSAALRRYYSYNRDDNDGF